MAQGPEFDLREDAPSELEAIAGRVTKLTPLKGSLSRAFLMNHYQEEVIVYDRYLMPLEFDDLVSFIPARIEKYRPRGQEALNQYIVGTEWEADLPDNEAALRRSIQRALNITIERATSMFEECAVEASKKGLTVVEWLDSVSERTRKRKKQTEMMKLQGWWIHHRLKRRLLFLRIPKLLLEEARSYHRFTYQELYHTVAEDPLAVLALPTNLVRALARRFEIQYSPEEYQMGEVARTVYGRIHHDGDSCYPRTLLRCTDEILTGALERFGMRERFGMVFDEESYSATEVLANDVIGRLQEGDIHPPIVPTFSTSRLTERQREAVTTAMNNPLTIITGEGGTGKSTIISELIYNCKKEGITYLIVSFTGTAVARVKEITLDDRVLTIHMALGRLAPGTQDGLEEGTEEAEDASYLMEFIQSRQLRYDALIVDEGSMVPSGLMAELIQKRRPKWFILIGDKNQLQPIGSGSLFRELLTVAEPPVLPAAITATPDGGVPGAIPTTSDTSAVAGPSGTPLPTVPLVRLDHNHRSKGRIYTMINDKFVANERFRLTQGLVADMVRAYKKLIDDGTNPSEIMLLTSHRELVGELNLRCQELVKIGDPVREGKSGRIFYLKDKVIMLKNNYLVGQMNGDMGRITEIGEATITVKFQGGRLIDFYLPRENELQSGKFSKLRQLNTTLLDLAFCTTVHKSQGKQAPIILLYIKPGLKQSNFVDRRMFNQCWLYTALSRAQGSIHCIGDVEAMNWIAATGPPYRHDCLARWIRSGL